MSSIADLSPTEYKVAEKVALGLAEKEIADEMCISPKTVHNHTYNIRKKINARCAVDIAREFILSLENPRKYFSSIVFLIIQAHIMFNCASMDLRKPTRAQTSRTVRTARKYNS